MRETARGGDRRGACGVAGGEAGRGAGMDAGVPASAPVPVPAVELRDVSFSYGSRRRAGAGAPILEHVDLSFEAGKVAAIVGPNGCGKTTTVKLMSRALAPSAGSVLVRGDDAAGLARKELARRVAVLAQGANVPSIRVDQLVMGGRYPHRRFLEAPSGLDRAIVREAMERAGCARFAGATMSCLSGGERQRVYLAMVLAQQADIVVMDEPTTYLDVAACFDLMGLVRELNADGATVVMVLHDLNLALSSCDAVALMEGGRVAAFGTPEEVVASGVIERVFDIRLRRVEEEGGGSFYCLLPKDGGATGRRRL